MIKLLDCTLRDGGYYNNWDFDEKLVKEYLQVMASIKIDFVEIGFRSLNNESFKGAFAFSTDNYLNKINIPESLKKKIGVIKHKYSHFSVVVSVYACKIMNKQFFNKEKQKLILPIEIPSYPFSKVNHKIFSLIGQSN